MDLTYRKAKKSDLDAMVKLSVSQNFDEVRPDFVLDRIKNGVCIVAFLGNELVGFKYGIRFCGDVFASENFLVSDKYRGKGLGTELSKHMFKVLMKEGYSIELLGNSDYYPPVKGAIKDGKWIRPTEFYKRLGYKLIAETDKTRLFLIDLTKIQNNN